MSVEVIELSPLKAAGFRWLPQRGGAVVTVVCKATFELAPGVATLAAAQDDVNERDLHAGNDPTKGLYSASDIAPYKRQADVTLVGRCFAKQGELAKVLSPRVRVGSIDKCLEVHADRFFSADGKLHDDNFFSKMALGYERTAGGVDTTNPVGMNVFAKVDDNGRIPAPNLQKAGEPLVRDAAAPPTPVGFGPIAAAWPARRTLADAEAQAWLNGDWTASRMPARWQWGYFNVAPQDQRCDNLADDAQIDLEHLHPDNPHLSMRLPGLRPCVFVEGATARPQRLSLRADTLWIDTNRLVVTLCWRGQVELHAEAGAVRALVAMCRVGEPLQYQQVLAMHAARSLQPPSSGAPSSGAPSSGAAPSSDPKTRIQMPKAGPRSGAQAAPHSVRTSAVPMIPSSDCTPAWLPPVSTPPGSAVPSSAVPSSAAPSSAAPYPVAQPSVAQAHAAVPAGHTLEVTLTEVEVMKLRQLAATLGCSLQDTLRHALAAFHHIRFPS